MYLYFCSCKAKFVENNDKFKPKLLTMKQWTDHYRKGQLSEKHPNVQANIMLLCFYVMPLICPNYKGWGENKTNRPMSEIVPVNSEAWVLLMAVQGHLKKKDGSGREKKRQMTTHKDVEDFIGLIEQVRADQNNNTGRAWDDALMELAKQQKEHEMSAQEIRLKECRWLR